MRGDTHLKIGVAALTGSVLMGVVNLEMMPLLAGSVASVLPDVDHDKAAINQALHMNKFLYALMGGIALYYAYRNTGHISAKTAVIATILIAVGFSRHRALTHSLMAIAAVFLLMQPLGGQMQYAVTIGYASHIISDCFTDSGAELLYPSKKRYKAPITIRTGGMAESIVSIVALIVVFLNVFMILRYMV